MIICAAVGLIGLVSAAAAQATFPGSNGRIAFSQGALTPPIGDEPSDLSEHSQVFTIGAHGGGLAQLTHVASDQGAASPDWSPDGKKIVYESNQSGAFHIWVMNANGSAQTQLTHQSGFEDFQPSWSPDGKKIVFSHCGEPFGPGNIVYCDIDVMNAERHQRQDRPQLRPLDPTSAPDYSPDGKEDRVQQRPGRAAIGGLGDATRTARRLKRLTAPSLRAFWPDWAPGGHRILFSDHCCLPHSNLWTVRPDGSGLTKLTDVARPARRRVRELLPQPAEDRDVLQPGVRRLALSALLHPALRRHALRPGGDR